VNRLTDNDSNSSTEPSGQAGEPRPPSLAGKGKRRRILVLVAVLILFVAVFVLIKQHFDLNQLVEQETALKDYYREHPNLVLLIAFLLYVLITALTIPVATVLSLLYAWFFGFFYALILISFASTAGATIAFLISRYILRDFVQSRFGGRLAIINSALEKEGAYYLFTLRLVPVIPFSVINSVMGLTKMKTITFWWISQAGMLAGTAVYVYAGSRIPNLETLQEKGVEAVFTPWQLTQITIAFALIGILPFAIKRIVEYLRSVTSDSKD